MVEAIKTFCGRVCSGISCVLNRREWKQHLWIFWNQITKACAIFFIQKYPTHFECSCQKWICSLVCKSIGLLFFRYQLYLAWLFSKFFKGLLFYCIPNFEIVFWTINRKDWCTLKQNEPYPISCVRFSTTYLIPSN